MSWRDLAILGAGFAAGGINSVVGSGTLITSGGWAGAHLGRRLPTPALRGVIVAVGIFAIVKLA